MVWLELDPPERMDYEVLSMTNNRNGIHIEGKYYIPADAMIGWR